jgi:hypothetical protein
MPLRGSHLQSPHHFRHQRPLQRPLACPLVRHPPIQLAAVAYWWQACIKSRRRQHDDPYARRGGAINGSPDLRGARSCPAQGRNSSCAGYEHKSATSPHHTSPSQNGFHSGFHTIGAATTKPSSEIIMLVLLELDGGIVSNRTRVCRL